AVGGIASVLLWFSSLVRGRAPRGLRDLVAWGAGYSAQLTGYLFLLTDRYPTSDPREHLSRGAARPAQDAQQRLESLSRLREQEPGLSLDEAMARIDEQVDAAPTEPEPLPPMPAQPLVG